MATAPVLTILTCRVYATQSSSAALNSGTENSPPAAPFTWAEPECSFNIWQNAAKTVVYTFQAGPMAKRCLVVKTTENTIKNIAH
jgi:hypothetical protein